MNKRITGLVCGNDLSTIYQTICSDLVNFGDKVNDTHELINYSIYLSNVDNCFINSDIKSPSLKYYLAETIRYLVGSNDLNFINKYAKLWNKMTDDNLTVNSAYGYIIGKKFGFNQLQKIYELLKKDKYSRRACIIINDANENVIETHDEQCTMYLQFIIRHNELFCITNMRSNDVIFGLPYDIPFFILIQKYLAKKLNVKCGAYIHNVGSIHVYDKDFEKCKLISMETLKSEENTLNNHYINIDRLIENRKFIYNYLASNHYDEILDICDYFGVFEK